jgi:hypothetical protein
MAGTPLTGGQRATGRPSAEYLSFLARMLKRCGDISPLTGHVCVTQPHEDDIEHMAVQVGGPKDGYVYARWGGQKQNVDTGLTHGQGRQVGKGS